jgi:hypothetical protein
MKKINQLYAASAIFAAIFVQNQAKAITCPPYEQVKQAHFIQAYSDKRDSQLWYLLSQSFSHDSQAWNISFGKFYYEPITAEAALKQGQAFFNQAPFKRQHPSPIWIPGGVFCDYMTEGSEYFVSANSPPQAAG